MLWEISRVHERYLQILKEVKTLKGKDIRPILMLQYRLDIHHDHYYIYTTLKVIGVFFTALHSLGLLGIGASVMALVARKIHQRLGLAFLLISSVVLALSHQVIPLKVTKGALLMGQQVSMAALGGLMEAFYRPILAQAKADGIPILDLPNTFNPYDSSLYIAQIEPSQKGGQLIAEGLDHIIKHHDFASSKSVMYSKSGSNQEFTGAENPGSSGWSVAYPAKSTSRFHIDPESKDKEEEPGIEKHYQQRANTGGDARKKAENERSVEHSLPTHSIPSQVKNTLDDLFGGPGSVDRLPVYEGNCSDLDVDTMANSSMVGFAGSKQSLSNPYIVTKMRCLSTPEEIKQKLPFITKNVDGPIERVLILRPGFIENPLAWEQDEGYGVHPQFFKGSLMYQGNFTYPNDGQLNESHVQGFELLKRLNKEGKGEDINGLCWEIIGHKS